VIPRVQKALLEGVGALEDAGIAYAVVGGLAVGVWSTPRATRDVDLYAELRDDNRATLRAALVRRGFDVPAMNEELARFGVFRSDEKYGSRPRKISPCSRPSRIARATSRIWWR
jgi:hypothetical protein